MALSLKLSLRCLLLLEALRLSCLWWGCEGAVPKDWEPLTASCHLAGVAMHVPGLQGHLGWG